MKICTSCGKVVADFEVFSTGECEHCYTTREDKKPLHEIEAPDFIKTLKK